MKLTKLLTILASIAAFGYLSHLLLEESSKDFSRISEWPKSVVENGYRYCDLTTYRSCSKGQWFGITRDTYFDRSNPVVQTSTNSLIDTACQPRSDPPQSRELRAIDISPSQRLVLCRLREPSTIDRGRMLMQAEKTPFKGML